MKIKVDMSASKGNSETQYAPDGQYVVEVFSISESESKTKKTPQMVIELSVAEGPYKGQKIMDYIPLVAACQFRIANFLKACGVENEDTIELDTDMLAKFSDGKMINQNGAMLKATQKTTGEGQQKNRNVYYGRLAEEKPKQEAPSNVTRIIQR